MKQTLINCLKASGKLLIKNMGLDLNLSIKESQSSIVTSADYRSDDLIIDTLRKRYPSHNIISDESGFIDCGSEFTWGIDR
jgi:myo-inositol-1(or 4)-monophosphatase